MLFTDILREKYNFINNEYVFCEPEKYIDKDFLEYCLTTDQNKNGLSIKANGDYFDLYICDEYVNICVMKFNCISIGSNKIDGRKSFECTNLKMFIRLVFNNEGEAFIKYNGHRFFVPLTLKNLSNLKDNYFINEIINNYFDYNIENLNHTFLKDIKSEYNKDTKSALPLALNDIQTYHSKKEMFINEYKRASQINVNYNKRTLNNSYYLIKISNYVDEKSFKQLMNMKDFSFFEDNQKNMQRNFCIQFYKHKFNISNLDEDIDDIDNLTITISDYITLVRELKLKVNLTLTEKSIVKEHDYLVRNFQNKQCKKTTVPKDSKFNVVDKFLPKEFERITTKKRLILEGTIQHHCVSIYSELINKDKCAIYSYILKDERVTIEIRKRRNKFYVRQAMKKFNIPVDKEEVQKITDILNKVK